MPPADRSARRPGTRPDADDSSEAEDPSLADGDELSDSDGMLVENAPSKAMSVGEFTIEGFSRAAVQSYSACPNSRSPSTSAGHRGVI